MRDRIRGAGEKIPKSEMLSGQSPRVLSTMTPAESGAFKSDILAGARSYAARLERSATERFEASLIQCPDFECLCGSKEFSYFGQILSRAGNPLYLYQCGNSHLFSDPTKASKNRKP
jgi:hypothetical protein